MRTIINVIRMTINFPSLCVEKIRTTVYLLYVVLTSWWAYPMELHAAMRIINYMSSGTPRFEAKEAEDGHTMKIVIAFEIDVED